MQARLYPWGLMHVTETDWILDCRVWTSSRQLLCTEAVVKIPDVILLFSLLFLVFTLLPFFLEACFMRWLLFAGRRKQLGIWHIWICWGNTRLYLVAALLLPSSKSWRTGWAGCRQRQICGVCTQGWARLWCVKPLSQQVRNADCVYWH